MQCFIIPCVFQGWHIKVGAPVRPIPGAAAVDDQSVGAKSPKPDIILCIRVDFFYKFGVAGIHVIGPEAADARKLLHRQFKIVVADGHYGLQDLCGRIGIGQHGRHALLIQKIGIGIERIHAHRHLVRHVSPPLRAFPIGAIHKIIAHGNVKGTQRFHP